MNLYGREDFYNLQKTYWWFVARRYIILQTIRRLYKDNTNLKIADIGCGSALMFESAKNFGKIFALDIAFDPLRLALDKGIRLDGYIQGDVAKIPFKPNSFDLIGCFDLLEHIDDDAGAIRSLYTSCKPGGRVIITVPNLKLLWGKRDRLPEQSNHKRRYSKKEIESKVREVGFDIEKISCINSFLFFPSVLWFF